MSGTIHIQVTQCEYLYMQQNIVIVCIVIVYIVIVYIVIVYTINPFVLTHLLQLLINAQLNHNIFKFKVDNLVFKLYTKRSTTLPLKLKEGLKLRS